MSDDAALRLLIGLSFWPIVGMVWYSLWRADRGATSTFKFVHFVTSDTGRGSPYALGYTVLVIVCAWGIWALIVLNMLREWYLSVVVGGFVLGTVSSTAARVMQRIKGTADPDPAAGDLEEGDTPPQKPSLIRTTSVTETVRVPSAQPPAAEAATDLDAPGKPPRSRPRKGRR